MSHNENLVPKKHEFSILFGQTPLTKFKDYRSSIKVELLNPEPKETMMKRIYQFVKATWADDPSQNENATDQQMEDALNAMLSGKALGLGLETVNLTFKISGITRIDTHQIVRQRIGVTFSQQCTGDRMMHHNEVLMEECINGSLSRSDFIGATLDAKLTYAKMIDNGVSIQAARTILPHNLETFIFMNTNLATLLFFYQKRIDDGSQTWEINEVARQMADQVCKAYPELAQVFDKAKKKFRFQREASADRANTFSTSLYLPKEDEFEYHNRDFLYNATKEDMHFTETPVEDEYFWGKRKVSRNAYEVIKKMYKELDEQIHEENPSNEEIFRLAALTNQNIYENGYDKLQ